MGGLASIAAPFFPPAAAVATGADVVSTANQMKQANMTDNQPKQVAPLSQQDSHDVMGNRFRQMTNDPGVQIADATASIAKMPPDIQQEYGPALTQAQKLAQGRRV